jgi:hypothetical protein
MSQPDIINPNLNYQSDVTPSTPFIVKDVALKAFLFSLVFYIMTTVIDQRLTILNKCSNMSKQIILSILFGMVFYFISINI